MLSFLRRDRKQIGAAILALWLGIFSLGGNLGAAQAAGSPASSAAVHGRAALDVLDPQVREELDAAQPGQYLTVIVTLKDQAGLQVEPGADRASRQKDVIYTLQAHARGSQVEIKRHLEARRGQGKVAKVVSFWIFNGLSVTALPEVIQEVASRADVHRISSDDAQVEPAGLQGAGLAEPNLSLVNAPALWELGYQGQNVVVANLDTGVDASHPDLANQWRGGTNSWFDPYRQHPTTPTDLSGHGTGTMGVMVGRDGSGAAIGMAPQAQWIAAKIFNDSGGSTTTAIHQSFEWLLDPDNNPETMDAPQVVNNSWASKNPGCDLEYQPDLQALVAAGILPVFSAGNYGSGGAGTDRYPANNPEAFSVGAVYNTDVIASFSSRGPSTCEGSQRVYPDLVAPGVGIRKTDLLGEYTSESGTSFSSPHAAGALALLLSAHPGLPVWQQAQALTQSAVDLGASGPDNVYGNGRLDVYAAYLRISDSPLPGKVYLPWIWKQIERLLFLPVISARNWTDEMGVPASTVPYPEIRPWQ